MRVVYLNPTGELGGAEASLLTLITTLRREYPSFEPHVITTGAGALTERCRTTGIPVEVLELPLRLEKLGDAHSGHTQSGVAGSALQLLGSGIDVARYRKRIVEAVQRQRPDLIHTNGLKMHLLGACLGVRRVGQPVPLIAHIHDYVSRRPLAGKLLRLSASRFTGFVANSESVARDLVKALRVDRVSTIYNAVDTERYSPRGSSIDLDDVCGLNPAEAGTIRIGMAATFARWKGHVTFLRALAKIDRRHEIRGYVIGGPIYRTVGSQLSLAELQETVNGLGLRGRVGFTGFLENTAQALRSLDIVVHASTAPEPFGLAIIEAMACGKPTIVSDAGGAAELFEEGVTGLGHSPGDETGLARKLEMLVVDRGLRDLLGRSARQSVMQRFQREEMASRFWKVYQEASGVSVSAVRFAAAGR